MRRRIRVAIAAVLTLLVSMVIASPAHAVEGDYAKFGEGITPNTPAVVSVPGHTIRIVRGTDGRLYWSDQMGDFVPIPGAWRTPFAPTAVVYRGILWVFIRGNSDNRLYYARLTDAGNNTWSPWTGIPGAASLGSPSAVELGQTLHVYYTGTDYRIYHAEYEDRWHFTGQEVAGMGRSESPPTAVRYDYTDAQIMLLHRGTDNRIYRQVWNPLSNSYNGWRAIGNMRTELRIAAASDPDNYSIVQLAARGSDGLVWHATLTGDYQTYPWVPVTGLQFHTDAAPTLYTAASFVGQIAVYLVITLRGYNDLWAKRLN